MGRVPAFPLPQHLGASAAGAVTHHLRHTESPLPRILLALCQRLWHRSGMALLLVFTHHRSQPDVPLRDGRRKPVALPHALGWGEPPQPPAAREGGKWHGEGGIPGSQWHCRLGLLEETLESQLTNPWKHQHRGFLKSLLFLRLKHLPAHGLSPAGSSGGSYLSRGRLVA